MLLLLRRIVVGLNLNPSVDNKSLLLYTHSLIKDGSRSDFVRKPGEGEGEAGQDGAGAGAGSGAAEGEQKGKAGGKPGSEKPKPEEQLSKKELALRRRRTKEDTFLIQQMPSSESKLSVTNNANTLVTFGLQLLLAAFSKNRLDTKDAQAKSMLDPFVQLLRDCCLQIGPAAMRAGKKRKGHGAQHASTSTQVIALALRCSCFLLRAPLPSLRQYVPDLAQFVFTLLHSGTGLGTAAGGELTAPCFKALGVIIRHCTFYEVSEDQLRLLVSFITQDIAAVAATKQHVAFFLLRAILARRLLLPELYDLVKRVGELMVQSHEPPVQEQCAAVFLQFLLDYPVRVSLFFTQFLRLIICVTGLACSSGRSV